MQVIHRGVMRWVLVAMIEAIPATAAQLWVGGFFLGAGLSVGDNDARDTQNLNPSTDQHPGSKYHQPLAGTLGLDNSLPTRTCSQLAS